MFKLILRMSKRYNEMQLFKSKKAHEILVTIMDVFEYTEDYSNHLQVELEDSIKEAIDEYNEGFNRIKAN